MVDCAHWHDTVGMLAYIADHKLVRPPLSMHHGIFCLRASTPLDQHQLSTLSGVMTKHAGGLGSRQTDVWQSKHHYNAMHCSVVQVVQHYPNMVHTDREMLPTTSHIKTDGYVLRITMYHSNVSQQCITASQL